MKKWDKVLRTAQRRQGLMLGEVGYWRQSLRNHKAPVHVVHRQPGLQKAKPEKFLLLQLLWLHKVLPPFPCVSSFREMRKRLLAEKTDAAHPLSKAGVWCLFRHAGRIVKWILAKKRLIPFQKQSHPLIGGSLLLKIKCLFSAGIKWIQM